MNYSRVIPVLTLLQGGIVKTVQFKSPRYIGDPINAVRIFNEKEVDELVILDISPKRFNRSIDFNHVREIVSESFMPVAFGGGIRSLEDINRLFSIGVEKVILNTYSTNTDLIKKAAERYGSQSIVVSIDVKYLRFNKKYELYLRSGQKKLRIDLADWVKSLEEVGVGEILLQSIRQDGMMNGYDKDLVSRVAEASTLPVIACGGAGSFEDLKEIIEVHGASAAAAGSMFVYQGREKGILINYPNRELIDSIRSTAGSN